MNQENIYKTPEANLEKNISQEELQNILIIAKRQKYLLIVFFMYFLLAGIAGSAGPDIKPLIQLSLLPVMLAVVIFTAVLCWKVYGTTVAIIMTILSIIPLINILVMLSANSRANQLIKSKGFRVGLLGANIKQMELLFKT